jgi:hypothetical protein
VPVVVEPVEPALADLEVRDSRLRDPLSRPAVLQC